MSPIVKQKRKRFSIPSKYMLLILTGICVVLMVLTFMTDMSRMPLNKMMGYVVTPFQSGITHIGTWITNRVEELGELRIVIQENQELKKQIDELTIENTQLLQEKYELNNLRDLFDLDKQYSDYKKTGARIIARDSGNWFHAFTIDKGSKDGIAVDMNVIASGGLVGRIVDVGDNWAKVNTIINDDSNVSGMIISTTDTLIVSGSLQLMTEGKIAFSQLIDSKNKAQVGDKIVTSQISDKFLPGILIGYISNMEQEPNNITKHGKLTPAVDFEHLEEVLIILETKQQIKGK